MGYRDLRLDPFQTVSCQRQGAEKRRPESQRMNSRTEVVDEAGQRQFTRTRATAEGWLGFEDANVAPGLGEDDGSRQSIWP